MPELAGIAQADVGAVLDDVGNDQDLGVVGQQELLEHVDLQFAKAAAEGDLLFGVMRWSRNTSTWWSRWAR
jgi:hypothetical protein